MRRTAAQRCLELAEKHGWKHLEDEGECISVSLPKGRIHTHTETHGLIIAYGPGMGDYCEYRSRASAYAIISKEILEANHEPCDGPDSPCPDVKWCGAKA